MDFKWTFLSADVELTNICAENCAMCPRKSLRRPQGFMSLEIFSRLLEVLVHFQSRVNFSGFGNPTLHPFWADCVKRVRAVFLPAWCCTLRRFRPRPCGYWRNIRLPIWKSPSRVSIPLFFPDSALAPILRRPYSGFCTAAPEYCANGMRRIANRALR